MTTALIPLYAVGVFTGFTLSQLGMVRHHRRVREPGWQGHSVINLTGAIATGAVLVVEGYRPQRHTHTVVVLVGGVHQGVLAALSYARSLAPDRLAAVSVVDSDEDVEHITEQWQRYGLDVELQMLHSPYRELTQPVLRYLDQLDARYEDDIITVVLPEFVLGRWWEQLLHNQSALMLKARLLFRRNTVVTSVPFHVDPHRREAKEAKGKAGFNEVFPDGNRVSAPSGDPTAPPPRPPERAERP